nr:diacylglycerol kinase delta [Chrysemys picta bellii]
MAAAGASRPQAGVAAAAAAAEESSDSEPEQEPGSPHKLIRKVSTSGQIRQKTVIKEGMLMKQTSSFQRWKRRYFKLRGRTLYYAKTAKSIIFDEVDLTDASVAESSTKNINNSFTVGFIRPLPSSLHFSPFSSLSKSEDSAWFEKLSAPFMAPSLGEV